MSRFTPSSRRVGGWLGLAAVMVAALIVTGFALARNTQHTPPDRPLAVAVHNALAAPPVAGVSARFALTEHLLPNSSTAFSSSPLAGATGNVWASGHRIRLLIRSQLGVAQIAYDGTRLSLYDAKHHTVYVLPVKRDSAMSDSAKQHANGVPSVARINRMLTELSSQALLSGAIPGNLAGQPAYTVKLHRATIPAYSASSSWPGTRRTACRSGSRSTPGDLQPRRSRWRSATSATASCRYPIWRSSSHPAPTSSACTYPSARFVQLPSTPRQPRGLRRWPARSASG